MRNIKDFDKSRIDVDEMQSFLGIMEYDKFVSVVKNHIDEGIIKPIKSSGGNGKKPELYKRYVIIRQQKDYSTLIDELKYKLNYELNTDYYLRNPQSYEKDRFYIKKLSDFLNSKRQLLEEAVSEKERSFQIWGREKYLGKYGASLFGKLKYPIEKLNYYSTSEPLAYYSHSKKVPQNILIVENMDTFYTIRRYMLDKGTDILGENIETVVYGAGKGIWKSFRDFSIGAEPYLSHDENKLLYLGDIDYEGIYIYENLHGIFKENTEIKPFVQGYCYMIEKAAKENYDLPMSKEGQNKNLKGIFMHYFSPGYRMKIEEILSSGKYIPQEIINYSDLKRGEFL